MLKIIASNEALIADEITKKTGVCPPKLIAALTKAAQRAEKIRVHKYSEISENAQKNLVPRWGALHALNRMKYDFPLPNAGIVVEIERGLDGDWQYTGARTAHQPLLKAA